MTAAELVERVARAQYFAAGYPQNWDLILEAVRDEYRVEARAAIAETLAAIREPTAMMIEAGGAALYQGDVIDPAHVFRMMIDALLMTKRKMLVDPACRRLADHFLKDVNGHVTDEDRTEFAEAIQRICEDFVSAWDQADRNSLP